MGTSVMNRKSRGRKKLVSLVAAVAVVLVILFAVGTLRIHEPAQRTEVSVSGLILRSGADIAYMEVSFTSAKTNVTYLVTAFGGVYHVTLPSEDTYTVKLLAHFVGYPQPKVYYEGTLELEANETSVRFDLTS
jgi:hypothetical protein